MANYFYDLPIELQDKIEDMAEDMTLEMLYKKKSKYRYDLCIDSLNNLFKCCNLYIIDYDDGDNYSSVAITEIFQQEFNGTYPRWKVPILRQRDEEEPADQYDTDNEQ